VLIKERGEEAILKAIDHLKGAVRGGMELVKGIAQGGIGEHSNIEDSSGEIGIIDICQTLEIGGDLVRVVSLDGFSLEDRAI
jgi:hypothetical protein